MTDISDKNDSSLSFAVGLLAGVVGGVAAAVLLTPKSGKENRELICEAVSEFIEKYSPEVCDAKRKAMEALDVLKCKLENKYRKVGEDIKAKQLAKAKEKETDSHDFN